MNDTRSNPATVENSPIRPHVRNLPPFQGPPVEQDLRAAGFDGHVRRMHLNECPYPPSPKVVEAIRETAAGVNRYPDSQWRAVTSRLAARTCHPQDLIIMGNGSDQILQALAEITLDESRSAIVPDPSFGRYTLAARIHGAQVIPVPAKADGGNDVEAMLAAVRPDTRLMYACTPNNPTGAMLTEAEVRRLADETPDHCLLALDEAYFEFARHAGGPDGLATIKHRKGPWVVLRTFSKSYGMAGLRVGYALCGSAEIADSLNKIRQTFHVNAMAQAAAAAALDDQAYGDWLVETLSAERDRLAGGLSELGLEIMPSVGNFVIARLDRPAPPVIKALADRGLMIGGIRTPTPGFENHIRITVGLPEDTDAALTALGEALSG